MYVTLGGGGSKEGTLKDPICVVGAGLSGLAAVRTLTERGFDVECFERGSAVGGSWRYESDSGLSAAYASLTTNTSRKRMQYPSFPMPQGHSDFPSHGEMTKYLESFADSFDLNRRISFRTTVEAARPAADGWEVRLSHGEGRHFGALVVAAGHYWDPVIPQHPGNFSGEVIHSRYYRTPKPFARRRVLVVGGGQSALDIAAEISTEASCTVVACRGGHYVLPRYLFGRPTDRFDGPASGRLPWPLARRALEAMVRLNGFAQTNHGLPAPAHRALEEKPPALASIAMIEAASSGSMTFKPGLERVAGDDVHFADGSRAVFDTIVYATGYRINFPFLPAELGRGDGADFPLYRRIVSPRAEDLYFIGIVEPGPGLLEIVERQSDWLGEVLAGRIHRPEPSRMWSAIAAAEPRSRRRYRSCDPKTIYCDSHAYLRALDRDLHRAKRARVRHSGSRFVTRHPRGPRRSTA